MVIAELRCEHYLCIYNNYGECIANEIAIDSIGCCATCMLPYIPEQRLDKYKKDTFCRFKAKIIKDD